MKPRARALAPAAALLVAGLGIATGLDLRPVPDALGPGLENATAVQLTDRHHRPLTVSYQERWNHDDRIALHRVPALLRAAVVAAEDRRFWTHHGVDWRARAAAALQNLSSGRVVRGASTITEQAVGLLHPRRPSLWSRWLEGFEARRLETRFGKAAVLEFYLNQVPYAGQRRGVVRAARYYFDRDLDTLSDPEMLALAVLIRSPTRLAPWRDHDGLLRRMHRLANALEVNGALGPGAAARLKRTPLVARRGEEAPVPAAHFVRRVRSALGGDGPRRVTTTLDGGLQRVAAGLLEARLRTLAGSGVRDGALLAVDHRADEVLVWVTARAGRDDDATGIDAVLAPRQPGSTLKPFVYALAMEQGWTAATLVDDRPLSVPVGHGLHAYRNYGRTHYGPVRVRDALGNSLNIPAVKALQFAGLERFVARLRHLGFRSVADHPSHYGGGIALGNVEVSLRELVGAYATLARAGRSRELGLVTDRVPVEESAPFSPQVASLIADILADPDARRLEFGDGGAMRLPVATAIKTGTSSDYRDAWALGFDHRHTVGVWLGNLSYEPTDGVTGSRGPLPVLRAMFHELARRGPTRPLWLAPELLRRPVCIDDGRPAQDGCPWRDEWFVSDEDGHRNAPRVRPIAARGPSALPRLLRPTPGLAVAIDPRIASEQVFAFAVSTGAAPRAVEWWVDGERAAVTGPGVTRYAWPVSRGRHVVEARVWSGAAGPDRTASVSFTVH